MPPKQRITKQIILESAFSILKTKGMSAVNARTVANSLHCSTQPIFSYFENMDDLKSELIKKAKSLYNSYIEKGLKDENAFKGTGFAYIDFASNEPILFKLLFMQNRGQTNHSAVSFDDNYEKVLDAVIKKTGFNRKKAETLYFDIWVFTHGIAVMIATNTVTFTRKQTDELLSDAFIGLFMRINSKNGELE